ncbi:MAG: hypothetical protein QOC65_160 [Sphingomonadales bacterium]|nr:hypothetical protein [Sphingomonadales bacterium]
MRLFKYVATPDAAAAIAGGSLKFTPIAELNDPMEVLPQFDEAEVARSLDDLRDKGCTDEQFEWLLCQQRLLALLAPEMAGIRLPTDRALVDATYRLARREHLPLMRQMLAATIGTIRSRIGVLSLSERADCVPMWAHYARDARGFAVALDGLGDCFAGDGTGSLNIAKPVLYSDRFLGMTFDASSQDRLFFAKLDDWRYEKEWRVVRALDQCRRVATAGAALHLHDIPPDHVQAVICGWNVAEADEDAVRRRLADVNPNALLVRTTIDGGRIVFDPELPRTGNAAAG